MFDFGADARNEGGENGQNHKGLVTFDRKYKKDSFYAYKAWLSDEPFVHICGKRYVDRVEDVTKVTVYSNQPCVELFANGVSLGKQECPEHFFYFDVPNQGETELKAVAGSCTDTSHLRKAAEFNDAYRLKEKNAILNWFDITEKEGCFSLNDKISDIMATDAGRAMLGQALQSLSALGGGKQGGAPEGLMKMIGSFTVLRLFSMASLMDNKETKITKEMLLEFNRKLNEIAKP